MRRPSIGWARVLWRAGPRAFHNAVVQEIPWSSGCGERSGILRRALGRHSTSIRRRIATGNPRIAQVLPGELRGGCCVRSHAASHQAATNGAFRTRRLSGPHRYHREFALRPGRSAVERQIGTPRPEPYSAVRARIKAATDSRRLRVRWIAVRHGMASAEYQLAPPGTRTENSN